MAKMFKFFKRHTTGNLDNTSDIVTDQTAINVSDSAPILTRNHFDLSQSTNSVHHDLRHATDTDGSFHYFSVFYFFTFQCFLVFIWSHLI